MLINSLYYFLTNHLFIYFFRFGNVVQRPKERPVSGEDPTYKLKDDDDDWKVVISIYLCLPLFKKLSWLKFTDKVFMYSFLYCHFVKYNIVLYFDI